MAPKPLTFPKYKIGTRVKIETNRDIIVGTISKIAVAPAGHIAKTPGNLIYLIEIETFNDKTAKSKIVTTAGEEEINLA